jgi:hypothetical protein
MSNNNGTIEGKLEEKNPNNGSREDDTNAADNSIPDNTDHPPPESQPESDRRRHQRGGRKTKTSDNHKPWSERNGRLEQPSEFESGSDGEVELLTATQGSKSTSGNGVRSSSETGFRAFNLKRAASTGGRVPFGVSVDREKQKKEKARGKGKKKKKKQQESSEEESEESDDDEPEKRKPVAIRLDLNLELEIFLRAKVKGDITITFL